MILTDGRRTVANSRGEQVARLTQAQIDKIRVDSATLALRTFREGLVEVRGADATITVQQVADIALLVEDNLRGIPLPS